MCEDGTRHFDGEPWLPPGGRGIVHAKEARRGEKAEKGEKAGEGGEKEDEKGSVETVTAGLEQAAIGDKVAA